MEMQTSILRRLCGQYCALHITNADEGAKCSQTISCFFTLDRVCMCSMSGSLTYNAYNDVSQPHCSCAVSLYFPLVCFAKPWLVQWQSRPMHMRQHMLKIS